MVGALVALLALGASLAALNWLAARDLHRLFEGAWLLSDDFPPAADTELRCTFRPHLAGARHPYFGVAIHTNAQGFRTGAFTPPGQRRRVVLLGDSIAFGAFLEERENLAARLTQALALRGVDAETFNLGVPTYNMREKAASYRLYGAALEPAAVVLQSKPGDFEDSRAIPVKPWMKRAPLALWLLGEWRRAQPVRDTPAGNQAYARLAQTCAASGRPLIALSFPFLTAAPFDDVWREQQTMLQRETAAVIDVGRLLAAAAPDLTAFRARPHDALHPNARAIQLAAQALAVVLAPSLAASGDAPRPPD